MNLVNLAGVTAAGLVILFAILRVERRALWVVLLLLVLPAVLGIGLWASRSGSWPETLAGVGLAALVVGAWWLLAGRKMAPASSDSIKVWRQERQPRPRAEDMAALQAENLRLKDEVARMEAELRRMRGNSAPPGDRQPPGPD